MERPTHRIPLPSAHKLRGEPRPGWSVCARYRSGLPARPRPSALPADASPVGVRRGPIAPRGVGAIGLAEKLLTQCRGDLEARASLGVEDRGGLTPFTLSPHACLEVAAG